MPLYVTNKKEIITQYDMAGLEKQGLLKMDFLGLTTLTIIDDAMKLIWAEFSERPFLDSYKALERHAKKASTWSEWRERALAEIRLRIKTAKEKSRGEMRSRWMQADADNSQLVEIFLYEGNPEEAWREAQSGGCSDNLWLRLAVVREKEYPADAAPIYLAQADAAVAATRNGRYEDSVDLLVKAASVMRRIDAGKEFAGHLEALRLKYKIKRNFIKLIEQKRKSLYVS